MLSPRGNKTFCDYAVDVFMPFIDYQLRDCQRLDIVWDVYRENSLKKGTRDKRGTGVRRKVTENTQIPTNWQGFLRVDENKTELYGFLAEQVTNGLSYPGKTIYCT